MATAPKSWTLFWLLALAVSIANGVNIAYSNFSTFEGSQAAVVRTIWYALPWLVAAFLASSLVSVVTYFLSTFGNHFGEG